MLSFSASFRGVGGAVGPRPELDRLLDRPVGHIRWGLDRISRMLAALGDPHRTYEVLHVGGTNGKGSVCAVTATLAADERIVGLYTSPHLSGFAERIRIGSEDADGELLEGCAARVRPLAAREGATYFEAATALALLAFAERGVQLAVVEVGLGGRLDATNVVRPLGCAIVSVGLDHCEYLGDSIEEVAAEKAGILKPGVPAVVGALPGEVLRVVRARAREVGAPLSRLGEVARLSSPEVSSDGTCFIYESPSWPGGVRLRVPLPGAHQAQNAAVALLLLEETGRLPEKERVPRLLEKVDWPGRVEVLEGDDPAWILDVAHNPAGARALRATLEELRPSRPLVIVMAMLRRKAWEAVLEILPGQADAVVLTTAPSHPADAAWDPAEAAAYLRVSTTWRVDAPAPAVEAVANLDAALDRASELAGRGTVVVAGSCYLVGDARGILVARGARLPARARSRKSD